MHSSQFIINSDSDQIYTCIYLTARCTEMKCRQIIQRLPCHLYICAQLEFERYRYRSILMVSSGIDYRTILRYCGAMYAYDASSRQSIYFPRCNDTCHGSRRAIKSLVESRQPEPGCRLYSRISDGACRFSRASPASGTLKCEC
jgi:hypothetical protein